MCEFCKIVAGTSPATVVAKNRRFVAILNKYPYVEGHVVIIHRGRRDGHVVNVTDLSPRDWRAFGRILRRVDRWLRKKHGAKAMRFWANQGLGAGQTIGHVHFHVLPFYLDEIPEELIAEYKRVITLSAQG